MSSTSANTAPEVLRTLDIDQLLAHRLQQDQLANRERKIARISHMWDHRKLLGKFAAYGTVIGLIIAFLIPSRFASTTRLMPPDPPAGQGMAMLAGIVGKMGGAIGSLGGNLLGMNTSADLFAGVLESRTIQNDLITKFNLRHVYGERRWIDARKELSRRTDISIDRKSGILTIQVTDHDPKRATSLAEEYVAQLNYVVTLLNTSSAHRERVFLEDRLGQVKTELEAAEKDFSQFASKNAAIDIKEQGKAMVEAAAILEGQLIAAQTELQGLRQIYTDQNIRVRATQARIDELRRQIVKMGGKAELESGSSSKDGEPYPSIRQLPLLGVTYADLYRRTRVEETVFETLTQQYEIAKVQEAKEVPSVKVLDPPEVPEKKVFPPRILLTVLGGVLAMVIGAGWVVGTDGWERIDPQDPGKLLVLHMASSVRPQLEYVVQQGTSISTRTRRIFAGSQEESGTESQHDIRQHGASQDQEQLSS
jgi:capsule polysaccharide export protein KpsE/RkpR